MSKLVFVFSFRDIQNCYYLFLASCRVVLFELPVAEAVLSVPMSRAVCNIGSTYYLCLVGGCVMFSELSAVEVVPDSSPSAVPFRHRCCWNSTRGRAPSMPSLPSCLPTDASRSTSALVQAGPRAEYPSALLSSPSGARHSRPYCGRTVRQQ